MAPLQRIIASVVLVLIATTLLPNSSFANAAEDEGDAGEDADEAVKIVSVVVSVYLV